MGIPYVILGGGVAAGYAAQEFVEQGIEPDDLCIVTADERLPYDRPPLSKSYMAGKKSREDILINPEKFYADNGVDVRLKTRIRAVDLGSRRLYDEDGRDIEFDQLLIATGSSVRTLDVPGGDLTGVHYLRSNADADGIVDDAKNGQRAVVVGGGYIGMEVAATLTGRGVEVTLVYDGKRLLERLFTPEMSAFFEQYYTERGVKLIAGQKAKAFEGDERVERVKLGSGQTLEADFVVVGVGVTPATGLFGGSELHMQDGGIVVNKYLQTNLPGIYAAGDVAMYYDVLYQKHRRIEHWDNAMQQGKHAAQIMHGSHGEYMHLPYFFSDIFDLSWEFWGDTDNADEIVYRGDLDSGEFSVWWLNGWTIVAAFVMNRPDDERDRAAEWIRMHQRVNPDLLANADVSPAKVTQLRV
ncbi:NAD(P)/FAD-dependent oxidoreductase [Aggregatilinea lenta]|uniref:NAD(P)/FAD-dependent oxidoreductase n=1 Tax=Aggregatilinea lenta TaxID=913108 RepID=UPI000E5B83E9|nr:FAD-dependent oxidoreductase [Aggregatilinea lenta]